jgi:predicted RNA-binding protein YlqC (UPF0109 family)
VLRVEQQLSSQCMTASLPSKIVLISVLASCMSEETIFFFPLIQLPAFSLSLSLSLVMASRKRSHESNNESQDDEQEDADSSLKRQRLVDSADERQQQQQNPAETSATSISTKPASAEPTTVSVNPTSLEPVLISAKSASPEPVLISAKSASPEPASSSAKSSSPEPASSPAKSASPDPVSIPAKSESPKPSSPAKPPLPPHSPTVKSIPRSWTLPMLRVETAIAASTGQIAGMIMMRIPIQEKHVGTVIGRRGDTISRVRDTSKAEVQFVKNKAHPNAIERVLQLRGTMVQVSKAMRMVLDAMQTDVVYPHEQAINPRTATPDGGASLTLLIHYRQIETLRDKTRALRDDTASGLQINIAFECAGTSTEKRVSIDGTVSQVQSAFDRIMHAIVQHPLPRQINSIHFMPGHPPLRQSKDDVRDAGHDRRWNNAPPASQPLQANPPPQQLYAPFHIGLPMASRPQPPPSPPTQPTFTQRLSIPEVCAGKLIGHRGATIRFIEQNSGARIQLASYTPSTPTERAVAVTGTHFQVSSAIALIIAHVETFNVGGINHPHPLPLPPSSTRFSQQSPHQPSY